MDLKCVKSYEKAINGFTGIRPKQIMAFHKFQNIKYKLKFFHNLIIFALHKDTNSLLKFNEGFKFNHSYIFLYLPTLLHNSFLMQKYYMKLRIYLFLSKNRLTPCCLWDFTGLKEPESAKLNNNY